MQTVVSTMEKTLGKAGVIHGEALTERHLPRGVTPMALLRPSSTEEVSSILKTCFE